MTAPEAPLSHGPESDRLSALGRRSWAWPVAWMVAALSLALASIYLVRSCQNLPRATLHEAGRLVEKAGQAALQVAAAFKQGTVTTSFTSYATTLSGSQYLQFATLAQQEVFTRTDESSLAFGYLPLPEVIVEARAPVTYTYYLDLNARWDFRLQDGVIYVLAPEIKFNKPAVDASRITYELKKKSVLRNTTDAMDNLKSSITWMTYQKAKSNIGLVRETGRKQTETFVENWLAKNFADGKKYPVKVQFRDEIRSKTGTLAQPAEK